MWRFVARSRLVKFKAANRRLAVEVENLRPPQPIRRMPFAKLHQNVCRAYITFSGSRGAWTHTLLGTTLRPNSSRGPPVVMYTTPPHATDDESGAPFVRAAALHLARQVDARMEGNILLRSERN